MLLAALLAVGGLALTLLLHGQPAPTGSGLHVRYAWVGLIGGFALAESLVLRLRVMQHEQNVTIAEVPFAAALVVLSPDQLVGVRIAGALLSVLIVGRRFSLKVVFNAGLWLAEAAVAAGVFNLLAGEDHTWGLRTWVAVLAAILAGPSLLSALATTVVIGIFEGRLAGRDLLEAVAEQAATSAALTIPALLALDALETTAYASVLVVPTLLLLVVLYRYVAQLYERHARLVRMHTFTHELNAGGDPEHVIRVVLDQVRVLLGVTHVEIVVRRESGDSTFAVIEKDGTLTVTTAHAADVAATGVQPPDHPQTGTAPRRLRRRHGAPADAAWLAGRGFRDAVVAPLPVTGGTIGSLVVVSVAGEVHSFTDEDAHLLASVGEQVSVAVRHAELLEQLQHASRHDPLTGLANRGLLQQAAAESLARTTTSVISVDLDGFKEVNDAFGHAHGDAILVEIARRLRDLFPAPCLPARLGGDEFVVLLPGVGDASALATAHDLRVRLEQPVLVGADVLAVGASVGVATAASGGNLATLLQHADLAMYSAKRSDHGPREWEPRLDGRSQSRTPLLGELRRSLAARDIGIALQPQVAPGDGRLVAVEALVRWHVPGLGSVPPEQLVATAERGGLMTEVTLHVLEEALRATAELELRGSRVDVSVNISARDLSSHRLVEGVTRLLLEYGVEAPRLTLELTETGTMEDVERAVEVMRALKLLGVRLSLDDFGTGFSSLQQLKRLPFDEIKIDREFVGDAVGGPDAGAIVRSVLDLGRTLAMRVVAEGVEDAATMDWLAGAGCERAQGYHIARPMTLGQLVDYVETGKRDLQLSGSARLVLPPP